jgi:ribonuclease HI
MERMVLRRVQSWCEQHDVLPPAQGGFRRGQTAEDQAMFLTQNVHMSWDLRRDHLAVFLDVQKAFDSVWHEGLVYKLAKLAHIPDPNIPWFLSYLTDRAVKVRVAGSLSQPIKVNRGLPQGAILSPTLFSIFVADLPESALRPAGIIQYADDSAIHASLPRAGASRSRALIEIQKALDQTLAWYHSWKLALATQKTKLRVFTPKSRAHVLTEPLGLKMGQTNLEHDPHPSTRYLGVHFDSHLDFSEHIKILAAKATSRINVMRAVAGKDWGSDRTSRIIMYKTWIRPVLEYGSASLTTAPTKSLKILERVQKDALRLCLSCNTMVSQLSLEAHAHIEPLSVRRLHKWIATGAKLSASNPRSSLVCDAWHSFLKKRLHFTEIPPAPGLKFRGGRASPFQIMRSAARAIDIPQTPKRMEPYPPPKETPWEHPNVNQFPPPQWPTLGSASSRSGIQTIKAKIYSARIVREHLEQGRLLAFTDGSATPLPDPTGTSGAAAVFSTDGKIALRTYTTKLKGPSNNIGAEQAGIELAIRAFRRDWDAHGSLTIMSDCQVVVSLCQGRFRPTTKSFWYTAQQIKSSIDQLSSDGKHVDLVWIPGHCGLPLNEAADEAAEEARTSQDPEGGMNQIPTTYQPTLSIIKSFTRARLLSWVAQEWWTTAATTGQKRGRKLYRFQPTFWQKPILLRHLPAIKNLRTRVAIERIRIGNGTLNRFLHNSGSRTNPDCDYCPGVLDQVEHRLFDCPQYDETRQPLKQLAHAIGVPLDLETLLNLTNVSNDNRQPLIDAFATYIEKTHLEHLFLWNPHHHPRISSEN